MVASSASAAASPPCAPAIAPWIAMAACALMASLYVGLLYAPSLLLRLPPPSSLRQHVLRRFACATIATAMAISLSIHLLPIGRDGNADLAAWLDAFGLRSHHWWRAILFPLLLTALLYSGPLMAAIVERVDEWREYYLDGKGSNRGECLGRIAWISFQNSKSLAIDILTWRNLVVAPVTEEVVFRSCMISTLLCAGFQPAVIIFFCPLFFGLAHANHFWELVYQQNCAKKRACAIVGIQLGYTTVFGWYASFLFLRTGNVLAPLIAHIFCNIMGFPDIGQIMQRGGLIISFAAGVIGFSFMLFPASNPLLYNDVLATCNCWMGYCKWIS